MKIGDIKNIKIARKYASALISSAKDKDKTELVRDNLFFISETLKENSNLAAFLTNPIIKIQDKKDVLQKVFSTHSDRITLDFLYLLADNNRLNAINEITNTYSNSYNKLKNIVKPSIISAIELSEEQKSRIVEKLKTKLNKEIEPEYTVNADIIGGLIVEIEDRTIDCSIKSKFENMKKQLTKGNRYGNN